MRGDVAQSCLTCGGEIPPKAKPGGPPKVYCSKLCLQRAADRKRYHSMKGCGCDRCEATRQRMRRRDPERQREYMRAWTAKNRERIREHGRATLQRMYGDPERAERYREYHREWERQKRDSMTEIEWAAKMADQRKRLRERADERDDDLLRSLRSA